LPETLFAPLDNYCERTGPEFWSEPLNAATNLSFIIAGIIDLVLCRRARADQFAWLLSVWVIVIGVGSGLFHTFANQLTLLADVLPILAFILLFTWYTLRRFLGLPAMGSLGILVAFFVVTYGLVALAPDRLHTLTNGTLGYLPAFLGMLFFGGWLAMRGHPATRYVLAAAGVFLVSATFRSVDAAVCETLPVGTHFLWHTLNGVVLGILAAAAALHGRAERVGAYA
jgi:hypothetical protein